MKKKKKLLKKSLKSKNWTTTKADVIFSKFIRERDKMCIVCKTKENLQASHFFSRNISSLRYDKDNVDALCYAHHYGNTNGWEYRKQSDYRDWKIQQLGKKRYDELVKKSRIIVSRKEAIKKFQDEYTGIIN